MRQKTSSLFHQLRMFADSHSFSALATLCVVVIAATAVWTRQTAPAYIAPPYPTPDEHYAASLIQEHLPATAAPTPLPTTQPPLWDAPLPEINVLSPFSSSMQRSPWSGIWAVHEAVDLQAESGTPVKTMAAGVVEDTGEDALDGVWITLRHSGGYTSRYASLALVNALKKGDSVRAGQTIGFVGSSALNESHLGPHLHLSVCKGEQAVDPLSLIR